MKLYYYQPKTKSPEHQNFGDALNPWMWNALMPGILNDKGDSIFVGIGTLLNEYLPRAPQTAVFSSGVGYGKSLPTVDNSWRIYCLRGSLSAKALGVSPKMAITDGALLLKRLFKPLDKKLYRISYMPHHTQAICGGQSWQTICQELNFNYIDPHWSIEKVLCAITQTEVLITEAMHGAIVANTFGIPWIPVTTSSSVLSFKWQDWCSSVNIDYQPYKITNLSIPWYKSWKSQLNQQQDIISQLDGIPLKDLPSQASLRQKIRQFIRIKRISSQFLEIVKVANPIVSDEKLLESLTVQLEEKLQQFKTDVAKGYFIS